MSKHIFVARPSLPPLDELIPYLQDIWETKTLTNSGPYHQKLETLLCKYLNVPHISLFNNATIGLLTAIQVLSITGEVITTPYSFVATSNVLLWHGIEPVFVDIHPETLNIDPDKIESAITPRTTAILAVHCYGRPCDVEAIQKVADKYGLKVIYDAAHAFGTTCHCGSILNHGDLSVLSFHATKVFNTFEGGAIVSQDQGTKNRIDQLRNFGFIDEVTIVAPGINGKMSEFNAALGILQLKYADSMLEARRRVCVEYRKNLNNITGLELIGVEWLEGNNFSYFPIFITEYFPLSRDEVYQYLKSKKIMARRYFFPLIFDFPMYHKASSEKRDTFPIASRAASQVLCLPIYSTLESDDLRRVINIIREISQ